MGEPSLKGLLIIEVTLAAELVSELTLKVVVDIMVEMAKEVSL